MRQCLTKRGVTFTFRGVVRSDATNCFRGARGSWLRGLRCCRRFGFLYAAEVLLRKLKVAFTVGISPRSLGSSFPTWAVWNSTTSLLLCVGPFLRLDACLVGASPEGCALRINGNVCLHSSSHQTNILKMKGGCVLLGETTGVSSRES